MRTSIFFVSLCLAGCGAVEEFSAGFDELVGGYCAVEGEVWTFTGKLGCNPSDFSSTPCAFAIASDPPGTIDVTPSNVTVPNRSSQVVTFTLRANAVFRRLRVELRAADGNRCALGCTGDVLKTYEVAPNSNLCGFGELDGGGPRPHDGGFRDEPVEGEGYEDEYLVGDFDGDGDDDFATRRHNELLIDLDHDPGVEDRHWYGVGSREKYLIGDFDGDGAADVAVVWGSEIRIDVDRDGGTDLMLFASLGHGTELLVGDWNGDGMDTFALRRDDEILYDYELDGVVDLIQVYGKGWMEDQYLVGNWDGIGGDNIAVRRGDQILMDYDFDSTPERVQWYGQGAAEDQYLSGDWDGDRRSNIAVRRRAELLMDVNFDSLPERTFTFGNGTR